MWNTFDYRHDLSLCGFIDYRQFLIFYEFLNGFRRFEDESVSAGGKFIYRMSGEIGVFVVPWFLYPISYRPIPKVLTSPNLYSLQSNKCELLV